MSTTAKVFLVAVLALAGWGTAVAAVEPEFLVLEVRLRSQVLAEAVPALRLDDRVYLPLGELARALEFAIDVDPVAGTAAGWFLAETRTFRLDVFGRRVTIAGKTSPLGPGAVLPDPEDLFVAVDQWSRWFPVDLEVDLSGLRVTVTSREPLPLERRLRRQERRKGLSRRRTVGRGADYPRVGTPYKAFRWPSLDLSLEGCRRVADAVRGWEGRYSLLASFDGLGLGVQATASGRDGRFLRDPTVRAGRADPAGGLLGPLDATEFQIGDVLLPTSPLVVSSRRGRGVTVSSFPLERPDAFDRTTIDGLAQPGWEVELYHNGVLIDFHVVGADGRYAFDRVPLRFGDNVFRVALYGPRGQTREEVRRMYVGPGLIQAGRTRYRLGVQEAGRAVLRVPGGDGSVPSGVQGYGEVERGFTESFSGGLSVATAPAADGDGAVSRHPYVEGSLRGGWDRWYAQFDGAWDLRGGKGLEASLQTSLGGVSFSGGYGRFRNFHSGRVDPDGRARTRARARVEGMVDTFPIAYAAEARRETDVDGVVEDSVEGRLSVAVRHVLATDEVEWHAGPTGREASGRLLLNTRAGGFSTRLECGYRLSPGWALRAGALTVDGPDPWGGSLSASWTRRFDDGGANAIHLRWGRPFSWCTLGLNLERDFDGALTAGLSLDLSVGRDPVSRRWHVQGEPVASRGGATPRVLLDADGDGVAGVDDPPVAGVGFLSSGAKIEGRTGDEGSALLTGFPVYRVATLSPDPDTFEDPFWVAVPEGFTFLTRPGAAPVLTFLLRPTGEIDGTIYRARGDVVRTWPGAKVRLVGSDGRIVREVTAAFDGFYLLDKVPLGTYTVRVGGAEPSPVLLTPEDDVRNGVDMISGGRRP